MRTKDPARNPVSAVAGINGYLLNSNGPKVCCVLSFEVLSADICQVYVKGFDDDERLMGLAFLDVQIYVASIKVFKNLILVNDFLKSAWLVSFQVGPLSRKRERQAE
jgi:cleavage and polyadenylation specificity factor subunit 1